MPIDSDPAETLAAAFAKTLGFELFQTRAQITRRNILCFKSEYATQPQGERLRQRQAPLAIKSADDLAAKEGSAATNFRARDIRANGPGDGLAG
ncbi:MAG: hypothetical protein L0H63_11065, partial [Nitrococcus sp.]|nr:hypothetical protein [Nitrococcus sp.]